MFVQSTNPVMSDPNRDRVKEMFKHLELAVTCELYMSETALESDVVLPETSFYEQAEIRQGMWLGPEVVLCQPAVAAPGEAKPPYEIVKLLAAKMGLGQYFPYEKWEDWGELMMRNVPMSLDELSRAVSLSRRQLERLFQKYLGCAPTRYYLDLRLIKARQLLLQTGMSVVDVALACGFVSAPHFSKCYRDYFGKPPRDERRRKGGDQ